MRIDFYQLGAAPLEQVIAAICDKLLAQQERVIVIAADDGQLARLDRVLWNQGPTSFLPHAVSGGSDDARQPVLLSTSAEPVNRARNLLIADGKWRDSALAFHRAFYVFDQETIAEARDAWRSLAGAEEAERHYWANEDGRWVEKSAAGRRAS